MITFPSIKNRTFSYTQLTPVLLIYGCDGPVGEGPSYEKVTIIGETAESGVFDPSVEYDGATGWLAYSAADVPENVHYGGIMMPQVDFADPDSFATYNTKERIIE